MVNNCIKMMIIQDKSRDLFAFFIYLYAQSFLSFNDAIGFLNIRFFRMTNGIKFNSDHIDIRTGIVM